MGRTGIDRRGALLVFGSAAVWSFGGAIARFITTGDSWTIVFWRSAFAALFLIGFMLHREGWRGTRKMLAEMGLAGFGVGACFATASTCFVAALAYTSVANILLMQAGAPLFAALMGFALFGERVGAATWIAIAAVICGIAIMVSESIGGQASAVGDALGLLMSIAFAVATVLTRRHAQVRMMPAVFLGTLIAASVGAAMGGATRVSAADAGLLFVFGALNLGLGMALFVTGVRLLPAALAALIGMAEPVLGPVWVWLVHGELSSARTMIGGAVVILALLVHIGWQSRQQGPPTAATGQPGP